MRACRAFVCAGLALWGVVVGGCGSASRDNADRTRPAAVAPGAPIAISSPTDGSRLSARDTAGTGLRLRTRVRGSARPGSAVFLHASCQPRPCNATATAAADGGWTLSMTLTVTRAARFVTIDATSSRQGSAPAAVTTIELVTSRTSRSTRRRRPAASRRQRDSAPVVRARPAAPPRRSLPRDVLVIGDSLAMGMAEPLRAALPGWRVHIDARIGRPLGEGMRILAAQRDAPAIVAVSLFTNDDPRATGRLAQAVRATATRPGGCAVWATIVRPPFEGVSYAAANQALEQLAADQELAPRLQLVDWRALVARVPSFIAGDGVHGTPAGYRALGEGYARAIRACAGDT